MSTDPAKEAALVALARERAALLVANTSPEDKQGLQDLQNTILAMALPTVRLFFKYMVKMAGLRGKAKAKALHEIVEISPVTEEVCMELKFHDRLAGEGRIAYAVLGLCAKDHKLDVQIGKIQPRIALDKWPEVLKHLSMLVFAARSAYALAVRKLPGLVVQLAGDKLPEYGALKVDATNTTLFVEPDWPRRIGIFIRLDTEVEVKDPNVKGGSGSEKSLEDKGGSNLKEEQK